MHPRVLAGGLYERTSGAAGQPLGSYQRRTPERTVLHELVARYAQSMLAELRDADPDGGGLPRYVEREQPRSRSTDRIDALQSTRCAAVSAMRRAVQLGHRPRRLQLNATTISSWQAWQRTRVKPCARMPHRRYAASWFEARGDADIIEHSICSIEYQTVLSLLWVPEAVAGRVGMRSR